VSEQEDRHFKFIKTKIRLVFFFVAAEKFVAFDGGDHSDCAFFAGFGSLNAPEAADFYRSGQGNLVGKGQQDLNSRTFLDVFGKKEVNPAGTDVSGFRAGLSNRRARGPSHGKRQPHAKALGGAAF
jgi:hypothetical protein